MPVKQWKQLTPGVRRLIIVAGSVDLSLRAAALIDLARRPPAEVRGSKVGWGIAFGVVNSAGVLPIVYFRRGRIA